MVSPALTVGSTPWPLAFQLRGQDPFVDLGPGWFAMGPGVLVRLFLVSSSFLFSLIFLPFLPRYAVAFADLPSSSVLFVALRVSLFPLFLVAVLLCELCLFFCLGCAWGFFFLSFSVVCLNVCVPRRQAPRSMQSSLLSLVFCRSILLLVCRPVCDVWGSGHARARARAHREVLYGARACWRLRSEDA